VSAREQFHEVQEELKKLLQGGEVFTCGFSGEDSDFIRFNKSEVRQAGSVSQKNLTLDLIEGQRHAAASISLSGDRDLDRVRVRRLVSELRETRRHVPEDPYLLYSTEVRSSEKTGTARFPDGATAVQAVREAGRGRDLVGVWASGGIHAGFANSLGQTNWFSTSSFNLDWSFYHQKDKAVKTNYAGMAWDPAAFERKVARAADQLAVVSRRPRTVAKGHYRVYLSPGALYELVGMLNWGGWGLKAHRTKQTPLLKMVEAGAKLAPGVSLAEDTAEGVAPNFEESGFIRPDKVDLIREGAFAHCLVSPRSAKEYGVPTNGASEWEAAESVDMAAGSIPEQDVLRRLDTGLWIGNLWYLNYSDRPSCRTTGMTRFATFWVEKGEIVAPIDVMRFDETIYRVLGENLVGLTQEREMILDTGTYSRRSTTSGRLPGALVDDFAFTL
jgi:predicted Zn-dependent protease